MRWYDNNSGEIERIIKKVVYKFVDPKETFVFLFGSRALGYGRSNSDYDIGLYKGERIPLVAIAKMKDELEDYPILVDIDIVDFAIASDEFKKLALKGVKIWNRPKRNLKLM